MSETYRISKANFSKDLLFTKKYAKAYDYVKERENKELWLEDAGDFARIEHRLDWVGFNVSPVGESGEYFSPEVFISPYQTKIVSPLVRAMQFIEGIILTGALVVLENKNDIGQDGFLATVYISDEYNGGYSAKAKIGLDVWYYPQESRWVIQTHDGKFELRGDENQELLYILFKHAESIEEIL